MIFELTQKYALLLDFLKMINHFFVTTHFFSSPLDFLMKWVSNVAEVLLITCRFFLTVTHFLYTLYMSTAGFIHVLFMWSIFHYYFRFHNNHIISLVSQFSLFCENRLVLENQYWQNMIWCNLMNKFGGKYPKNSGFPKILYGPVLFVDIFYLSKF